MGTQLVEATDNLQAATRYVLENAPSHQKFVGAVAYNYLMMTGYIAGGWYMACSAEKALEEINAGSDDDFYIKKIATASFYFGQILPRHKGFLDSVVGGADIGISLSEESF